MGRTYAGILGPLAFFAVAIRGIIHRSGAGSTSLTAAIYLFVFAAIGYLVGELAGWIVSDSVRSQIAKEIAAQTASAGTAKVKP